MEIVVESAIKQIVESITSVISPNLHKKHENHCAGQIESVVLICIVAALTLQIIENTHIVFNPNLM